MSFFNPYLSGHGKGSSKYPPPKKRPQKIDPLLRLIPECLRTQDARGYKQFTSTLPPITFLNNVEKNIFMENGDSLWKLPPKLPETGTSENLELTFHVYDVSSCTYTSEDCENVPFRFQTDIMPSGTVIRLLGRLEDGTTVCVNVFGQLLYFYVQAPNALYISSLIQNVMAEHRGRGGPSFTISPEKKIPLTEYCEEAETVFKVTMSSPIALFPICAKLREAGCKLFETNVDATQRFLIDRGFTTFGWFRCVNASVRQCGKDSRAQIEVDCSVNDLEYLPDRLDWPPYNILAFDIECVGESGFPCHTNEPDQIIQISCVFWNTLHKTTQKTLLSIGTCAPLDDTTIYEFPSEFDMLMGFLGLLRDGDIEFITGYNISNFDLPYIINRATLLYNINCGQYCKVLKNSTFEVRQPMDSGAGFMRAQSKIRISGIVPIDMYVVCKDKLSLSDYKLNTVATHCLKACKEDVSYKEIPTLFRRGPQERARVGKYCVMDSLLVLDLLKYFMSHVEIAEIGKLAKIPLRRVLTDGQQIRVWSSLLDASRQEGYILPSCGTHDQQQGYQGATVINPVPGFYNTPILVVDFASLYPSIIQAHNLCYSTIIPHEKLSLYHDLQATDYDTFNLASGPVHFVKPHKKESVLSRLLTKWLAKRKEIRKEMANCTDETHKTILDKQQLAIKLTCNSVYGFTGVASGLLPCLKIAETVTYRGRQMLEESKAFIENITPITLQEITGTAYSMSGTFQVIYGDTDSLFIKCENYSLDEVLDFCEKLADRVTKELFRPPIKLEAEKTFKSLLMIAKKRYIGILSNSKRLMKGVDLVRKTACIFVQEKTSSIVDLILHDPDAKEAAQEISRCPKDHSYKSGLPSGFSKIIQALNSSLNQLVCAEIPIEKLTFTNELSRPLSEYKTQTLPHLIVYKKLASRQEELPQIHDRIPYVYVEGSKKDLKSSLAEHPAYVVQHRVPIAHEVYFDKLLHSVANILQCLFHNDLGLTVKILYNFTEGYPTNLLSVLKRWEALNSNHG
ncbi:DNA polymerase [Cricetid gammaherpesvirus 2]|uniref:DNA polymerase n=1 Tax=Cricetid gammaherpesvirus 2 TaxID=1605972 RepID=E9M5J6_9GAMA|nr:DNA polymerase [Cricetid gammaherpesvirus 2]ADW24354.1 DNA polymerase [Cricetid gammaherpesvirus 2]ADW24436.1 DNA polymerase [Cricetid gammaherpesvirus 2]